MGLQLDPFPLLAVCGPILFAPTNCVLNVCTLSLLSDLIETHVALMHNSRILITYIAGSNVPMN